MRKKNTKRHNGRVLKMKLYVFPEDSIKYIEETEAIENLQGRAGGDSWCLWPELRLSMQQRQQFKPSFETTDAVVSNDPFIISAFKKEDVIICKAHKDRCTIKGSPDFQTFGSAIEYIIPEMFKVPALLSQEGIKFMSKAEKSTSMVKLRDAIYQLGESFEKRFVYEKLCKVAEKKQKKKKTAKRGRPKGKGLTTGRFETRDDLVENINFMYWDGNRSVADAARNSEVSETTAHKLIMDQTKWNKLMEEKYGEKK